MSEKQVKAKPRGKPFTGADDPRRGTGGRLPSEASITHWLKKFSGMTAAEVAEACEVYAKEFRKYGKGKMTTAGVIAARAILGLMYETNPKVLAQVLDRTEGKVALPIVPMTWQEWCEKEGIDAAGIFNAIVAAAAGQDASASAEPTPDRSSADGEANSGA